MRRVEERGDEERRRRERRTMIRREVKEIAKRGREGR